MALVYIDGFDNYASNAEVEQGRWSSVYSTSTAYMDFGTGRNGSGKSLRFNHGSAFVRKGVPTQDEYIVGFAYYPMGDTDYMLSFNEGDITHGYLRLNGSLLEVRTPYSILAWTDSIPVPSNTWSYIEMRFKVSNTVGEYEVKVNGQQRVLQTGVDTQNGNSGIINNIKLLGMGADCLFDDCYILDTTGPAPCNTFLGDVSVETLPVTSDSAVAWTRSGGATNYENVDELATNDDTDYVSSATVNQQDLYGCGDISANPDTVYGVQVIARTKKEAAGDTTFALLCKEGATTGESAAIGATTDYTHTAVIWDTNPDTGAQWTKAEANAAEIGIKVKS